MINLSFELHYILPLPDSAMHPLSCILRAMLRHRMPMLRCPPLNVPFFQLQLGPSVPLVSVPSAEDFQQGIFRMGLPQLPLTTLNSVVAVAELARQLFPERDSRRFRPSRFALSVGMMNLAGCWFGALPTCHGAGGMAAQVRRVATGQSLASWQVSRAASEPSTVQVCNRVYSSGTQSRSTLCTTAFAWVQTGAVLAPNALLHTAHNILNGLQHMQYTTRCATQHTPYDTPYDTSHDVTLSMCVT